MKYFKIILLLLFPLLTWAQESEDNTDKKYPEVTFEKKTTSIQEPDDTDVQKAITITVKGGEKDHYPLKIRVVNSKKGNAESEDYKFKDSTITFESDGSKVNLWVTVIKDSKRESEETVILSLEENDTVKVGKINQHTISISDFIYDESLRVTTGIDFDFEPNNNPISLYGELNGFYPNLSKSEIPFGLMFKIFSNKHIQRDSLFSSIPLTFRTGDNIYVNDTSGTIIDTLVGTRRLILAPTENTEIRHYGFSVSPIFQLNSKHNNKFAAFFSTTFEAVISKQNTRFSHDTLSIRVDTMNIREFENIFNEENGSLIKYRRRTVYTFNIGIGLPMRITEDDYEVRIIPTVGSSFLSRHGESNIFRTLYPYYSIDVNVIDKNFGITIGAEFRSGLISSEPFINIYIAKSFSFKNFIKFD